MDMIKKETEIDEDLQKEATDNEVETNIDNSDDKIITTENEERKDDNIIYNNPNSFFKQETQFDFNNDSLIRAEAFSHIEESQDIKPMVSAEEMEVKMENDLPEEEERELDGNLSQSANNESGLILSDDCNLCIKGKLCMLLKTSYFFLRYM